MNLLKSCEAGFTVRANIGTFLDQCKFLIINNL